MSQFSLEIEALRDALTERVSQESDLIEQARRQFVFALGGETDIIEADFLEWLVWDFRHGGKTLINRYHEALRVFFSPEIIKSAEGSKLSFVQWQPSTSRGFFKDILTNVDYPITAESDSLETADPYIALMRLFKTESGYMPVGEVKYYSVEMREAIRRGILEKYNAIYTAAPQSLEEFVYGNPLVLYAYAQIIEKVSDDVDDDGDLKVYQATYKITDEGAFKRRLSELTTFEATEDSDVYVLELPEAIIAEVVIEDSRLDIEATDGDKLLLLKKYVEEVLVDCVAHLKDDVLTMEDLL